MNVNNELMSVACLLDLLREHPAIQVNPTLLGAVSVILEKVIIITDTLDDLDDLAASNALADIAG